MRRLTIRPAPPALWRVLDGYAAAEFDPRRKLRKFSLAGTRERVAFIGFAIAALGGAVVSLSIGATGGWLLVTIFGAIDAAMIIAHRRTRSLPEAIVSIEDACALAVQLLSLSLVVTLCWGAVYQTTTSIIAAGVVDRVEASCYGIVLAVLAIVATRVALHCTPALLSRRTVRLAHPLNAVAIIATWLSLWVLTCAIVVPVLNLVATAATTVGAVLTVSVFFVGVAAVRLRSLHSLVAELAEALDAYSIELARDAGDRDRDREQAAYLVLDRLMHMRPVGLAFAAPRRNVEKAVQLGAIFIGDVVSGVPTNIDPVHSRFLRAKLETREGLRREAAAFVRYVRSALLRTD